MVNEKAYKVSIIPALKQSFSLVFKAKRELVILGWLPFLLFTMFGHLRGVFTKKEKYFLFRGIFDWVKKSYILLLFI